MKKLVVPAYGWRTAKALFKYAETTKAKDPWGGGTKLTKAFKKDVTAFLLVEQSKRCAYCGGRLFEKKPHRDHIAPKEKYRKWMFWPENLVLACFACNTDLKATFDPIAKEGATYRLTEFSIVHPYLDEPTHHIKYAADGLCILISPVNNSLKGLKTIQLFGLSDPERAKQRAKDFLLDLDAKHLHGDFRELYQAVVDHIQNQHLKTRIV
ncbi:MAG: HNH endonuclease [Acidovorax sp.]|uniref:HNH endonuclease n=1 Tax=Acidovorax sp. TaxID=1872122 RepID=UPI0026040F95|nr:HNH endonuclease [Acidovorax sp.]MDH4466010.1 HNH endonuclease [Acidovorax sp.]